MDRTPFILQLLDAHGVNTKIENDTILAEECYTLDGKAYSEFVDVTHFTTKQLLLWLGY